MAKRSPILGFNHNFRHRGLVFHVQTEDSGLKNPHIFTHLFNGGVILSSRKLTYDAGAAEEVVKALMQAQHKAMLKDLKRGEFDTKIEDYFGDDPKFLREDAVETNGMGVEDGRPKEAAEPASVERESIESASVELESLEPASVELEVISSDEEIPQGLEPIDPDDLEELELELELDDVEMVEEMIALATDMVPKDEVIPLTERRENPFEDLDLGGDPMDTLRGPAPPGPVGETPSGAVVIHAKAPDSAPQPPGADPQRPGQYSRVVRKATEDPHPSPAPKTGPRPPVVAGRAPAGKASPDRRSRPVTQPFRAESRVSREVIERRVSEKKKSSVIVGAPPQVIGQPSAPTPRTPTGRTPTGRSPAGRTPTGRTPTARKAREQSKDGNSSSLFGKDLISEKSLDEVILAYLSEDPNGDRE